MVWDVVSQVLINISLKFDLKYPQYTLSYTQYTSNLSLPTHKMTSGSGQNIKYKIKKEEKLHQVML